jgi:NAD(P)-dependent dehydrogenase (short-subunit alcohol dehydrogenase family)
MRLGQKGCGITGAEKDIGRAMAAMFVREGASLEIADIDEAVLAALRSD